MRGAKRAVGTRTVRVRVPVLVSVIATARDLLDTPDNKVALAADARSRHSYCAFPGLPEIGPLHRRPVATSAETGRLRLSYYLGARLSPRLDAATSIAR